MAEPSKKHAREGRPSLDADYARQVGVLGHATRVGRKIKTLGGAERLLAMDESARQVMLNAARNCKNAKPKS